MVSAMSLHRLKETDAARRELATGEQIAEKRASPIQSKDLFTNNERACVDWIIAHVLMDEAKTLIEAQTATASAAPKSVAKSLAIGILLVMKATVTVDEVGRMVLPKDIREAIGVSGRTAVNIEVVENSVRITPPESAPRATGRRRGRLVYTGSLPEKWDSGEAVLQMRQRRLRR